MNFRRDIVHDYPSVVSYLEAFMQLKMAKLAISRFHSCIIKFQRLDQELKWNELALPAGSLWGDPSVKN